MKSFRITGTAKELGAIGTPTEFVEILYAQTVGEACKDFLDLSAWTKWHIHIDTVQVATVVGIGDCVWATVDPEEWI